MSRTTRTAAAAGTLVGSAALVIGIGLTPSEAAAPSDTVTSTPAAAGSTAWPTPHGDAITFRMVRSAGVVKAGCLPKAKAVVTVREAGPVEIMDVYAKGLPAKTSFDFFVLQAPDLPFGLSWYQGDLDTDRYGRAHGTFVGRFNAETFTVAPGSTAAPVVHDEKPFPDAASNPATAPVHQYHLGFWFNSPDDAAEAGCGNVVTPFNGDHHAGTQAMSTRQFTKLGPLSQLGS